jgi:hypothetical protein
VFDYYLELRVRFQLLLIYPTGGVGTENVIAITSHAQTESEPIPKHCVSGKGNVHYSVYQFQAIITALIQPPFRPSIHIHASTHRCFVSVNRIAELKCCTHTPHSTYKGVSKSSRLSSVALQQMAAQGCARSYSDLKS